jgi:hypothetical protein
VPLAAAMLGTLAFNHALFGSYTRGPQGWEQGEIVDGTLRALLSLRHGLLPYAPIVLSALVGWPAFLRLQPQAAWLAAGTFLCLFAVTAAYLNFGGGYCYGPRYLTPVIPFLMLGLLFRAPPPNGRLLHTDVAVLGLLSIVINTLGAIQYWRFFSLHPFARMFG